MYLIITYFLIFTYVNLLFTAAKRAQQYMELSQSNLTAAQQNQLQVLHQALH